MGIHLIRGLGRLVGVRRALAGFEVALTRKVGLFDREYYLSQLGGTDALKGMSPLRHYVLHGDAQGLSPSPLFDPGYYDSQHAERRGINRLLHYGLVARFRGQSPTPWFDPEYYVQSNADVAGSHIDALVHFQRWGWREGRSPLPGMDMHRLLARVPDMRVAKANPLAILGALQHDATRQHALAMTPAPTGQPVDEEPQVDLLDPTRWQQIEPRRYTDDIRVDVVIPVYGGLNETLACLWSVLTAPVRTPHEVIVVNDAGPVPELNAMLRLLANRGLFHLEQHRQNLGFVKTANHGLRLHKDRDVVILNSDTEVYNDWLDRLCRHAEQYPRAATVTPLSNNATICSYPEPQRDNRTALELPYADIDRLAAQANGGRNVVAPTGVGFCMFMRREAMREIGLFDERHFGRGYGEENDFCQRAQRKGWINLIACDIYVRHVGSVSFKAEASERTARAMRTLRKLHPEYASQVERHIAVDAAWIHRARLDLARMRQQRRQRNVLMVCHNRGGGTERHLLENAQALNGQGVGVFELRPSRLGDRVALVHPSLFSLHNLASLPLDPPEVMREMLAGLDIHEVHVHHLIDFPRALSQVLRTVCQDLGIAIRLAVHDYYAICPRVNLVDLSGRYCGEPEPGRCNACLGEDRSLDRTGTIERWRAESASLLSASREVIVPSPDVARRLDRYFPGLPLQVAPHDEAPPRRGIERALPAPGAPLKILVIGAISRIKGYDAVLGLAEATRQSGLPLQISLLGYSADDLRLAEAGVALLGRYFDNEILDRISASDPDLVFVPSIWPETYCYVLSGALRSGRRVAVFDIGAQAERVRAHDDAHLVLPLPLANDPTALARTLLDAFRTVGDPPLPLRVAA